MLPRPFDRESPRVDVKKIAIVGAGQMGAGIAQVAAQTGIDVVLVDVKQDLVQRATAGIRAQLDRAVSKGKLKPEAAQEAVRRIRLGASAEDAAGAQLAVEAVTENEGVKTKVFQDM